MNITLELLKKTLSTKSYKWFKDRPNLIGIRTTLDVPDAFNDVFCLVYSTPKMPAGLSLKEQQTWLNKWGFRNPNGTRLSEDGKSGKNTSYALEQYNSTTGKEILRAFPNTTNPGVYWLKHPENKLGTAILKPGQWVNCWAAGFHQMKKYKKTHRALVQIGNITVYRDHHLDDHYHLSDSSTQTGNNFGINIHGSGKIAPSKQIGKWSAGCQVFSNWDHKELVMDVCDNFTKLTGNKFTYTLIDEKDLY